ncbi:hypothetical protein [Nonomuraea guangzhouensis]|uniref:Secreted protein n=1 Tax=Nonomuraea guangzhouensis TaxID=1291555 RepID=A0ABW4GVZ0_9ACTN|nr:hypothetical protein [Nonomuraea guangzhouensis]
MIKKLCTTGIVVAAGTVLMAAPAQADTDNRSSNSASTQSGNIFGNLQVRNAGSGSSTNVTNVNGNAATATGRSGVGVSTTTD